MSILNISDEDQQNVYRVLAAVLHIGQLDIVTSEEENSDDAVIANQVRRLAWRLARRTAVVTCCGWQQCFGFSCDSVCVTQCV